MKLILAIIRDIDDIAVVSNLVQNRYRVTRLASTGGFLRKGNVTLVVGVEDQQVQSVIDLLQQACQPAHEGQHRVTLFVLNAEDYEHI
jgi:uncharacterized protein YaaQ